MTMMMTMTMTMTTTDDHDDVDVDVDDDDDNVDVVDDDDDDDNVDVVDDVGAIASVDGYGPDHFSIFFHIFVDSTLLQYFDSKIQNWTTSWLVRSVRP